MANLKNDLGLVIEGKRHPVPGVRVITWLDDPKRAPKLTDGVRRASKVDGIVVHTSRGILVGVKPGSRASRMDDNLALYQTRAARAVSWHITIGTDGEVYQQEDLATWTAYHVETANHWTVGIELAQNSDDPSLYRVQLDAMVAVVSVACDAMGIPRRVLVSSPGVPLVSPVPSLTIRKYGGLGRRFRGVLGHCHLVPPRVRGPGDPGPEPFAALLAAGFEGRTALGVDP